MTGSPSSPPCSPRALTPSWASGPLGKGRRGHPLPQSHPEAASTGRAPTKMRLPPLPSAGAAVLVGRAPAPWGQLWGQGEAPGDPPFKGSWTGVWAVGRPLLVGPVLAQRKPPSPSSRCAAELGARPEF